MERIGPLRTERVISPLVGGGNFSLTCYDKKYTFVHCGGLDENAPCRLLYLNAWFAICGTVWGGGLDMRVLAEGSMSLSLGMDFDVKKPHVLFLVLAVLSYHEGGGFLSLRNCELK